MRHKKRKNSLAYIVFTAIFVIALSSCVNLFEKEQKTLTKIILDEHNSIEARLITTGATTKDVIQIVFIKGKYIQVIGTFESYNSVELIKMQNDSLLVKLSDSLSNQNYIDTQYIRLPK